MRKLAFLILIFHSIIVLAGRESIDSLYSRLVSQGISEVDIADSLLNTYNIYHKTNPRLSFEYVHLAKSLIEKNKLTHKMPYIYTAYGNIYAQLGLNKIAVDFYDKAYRDLLAAGDTTFGWLLVDMGNVYFSEKLYDMAWESYDKAHVVFKSGNDLLGQSVVYLNYALINESLEDLGNALKYIDTCINIRKNLNDPFLVAHALSFASRIYIKLQDYEKAIDFALEAEEQLFLIKNIYLYQEYVLQFYQNFKIKSQIFYKTNRYPDAITEINKGIGYLLNIQDTLHLIDGYRLRGHFYHKINDNRALEDFQKALMLSEIYKPKDFALDIYTDLADYYYDMGFFDKSIFYLKEYIRLNDSLQNENDLIYILSIRKAFDDFYEETEKTYLKEKQRSLMYLLVLLCLIIVILILFSVYIFLFRLRQAEKTNLILDNAFAGIIIHNKGIIKFANKTFEQYTGYTTKELKNKNLLDLFYTHTNIQISQNIAARKEAYYISKLLTKHGDEIDVEMEGTPLKHSAKGERILTIKDIREKVAHYKEIRMFKTIIEQNYNSIVVTDINGSIEYVNPAFTKLTGYTTEEALGKNPRILKSDFNTTSYYQELWKRILAGKAWRGTFKNVKKDGSFFWEDATITPIKDGDGQIFKFVAIKQDITRRKTLEENYLESLSQFNKIFDSLNAFLFVFDFESEALILSNEKSKDAFHLKEGKLFSEIFYLADNEPLIMPKRELADTSGNVDEVIRKEIFLPKENAWYDIDMRLIKWIDEKVSVLAIAYNIDDRKKNTDRLNELNAMKDKFFSIIAHDLRNPFQALFGISELLLNDVDLKDTENVKLMIHHINDTSRHSFRLLENLLEWARSQTNLIEVDKEIFPLKPAVLEVSGLIKTQAGRKKIIIDLDINENMLVYADKNIFSTVIRNLLSNAVKFSNNHGLVSIKAKERSQFIEVIIEDNGIGIPKEAQDVLFRIDTKYTSTGTSGEKGTGLGLILCKELIEKEGGHIWLESEFGKGSRFIFTLSKANDNTDGITETL